MPRHRLFIAGRVIFGLASLLCAAAPPTDWLIFGRVVQAIGATMFFDICMPIIAAAHVGGEACRSRAVGAIMTDATDMFTGGLSVILPMAAAVMQQYLTPGTPPSTAGSRTTTG